MFWATQGLYHLRDNRVQVQASGQMARLSSVIMHPKDVASSMACF